MLIMRMIITGIILALTLTCAFLSVSATGAVGDQCCDQDWACTGHVVMCNAGLSCCYSRPQWEEGEGGICYDSTVSTCASCPVYNPNHPQTTVCPNTAPTCCGGCIDNTRQCCHHYGSFDFFQCEADQTCCGFDNGQHTCCNSNQACINDVCVPCPGGTLSCGSACYKSAEYVCVDASRSLLCSVADPLLCGDACYNQAQYTCLNGELLPIQSGGNPTQAPTQAPTPAPGCVMSGDEKCGTRCYSPVTHVCANPVTSFLCPVAEPSLCGANACYSASQYTCNNGQLLIGSNATPAPSAAPGCVMPGDHKCGDRCYSPATHVCANPATSFLCPVAFPSLCGANACYSTSRYTCVNGSLQPK